MVVKKLTHEEATSRVVEYFKGRCTAGSDAYTQRKT